MQKERHSMFLNQRVISAMTGAFLASVFFFSHPETLWAQDRRPHIIIITADDMGWRDIGYHGSEIRTPFLDALARDGVRLRNFYVHPTCSPTRAALMTGRAPMRMGIYQPISKNMRGGLPLSVKILPQYFQEAGYQTFLSGKWHLGHATRAQLPLRRGFDHFYGLTRGGIGYWDHVHGGGLDWQRNGETLREEGYATHLLTEEAVRLIKGRDKRKPLFLYLSFTAPHLPNEAPEQAVAAYAHLQNPHRRVHAAMISEMDRAVGRLVATLQREGMRENTLIWFFSDNGGLHKDVAPPQARKWVERLTSWLGKPLPLQFLEFIRVNIEEGGSDNGPFRGGKMTVYEGGVRVPSFVYWPRGLRSKDVTARITVQDLLPTLGTLLSFPIQDPYLDGVSHWRSLYSDKAEKSSDLFTHAWGHEAVYSGRWKLILLSDGVKELYDLRNDPYEKNNLATRYPEHVKILSRKLARFPHGESIHDSLWSVMLDPDLFGGEEDRPPWSDLVEE